ncbi:MAG: DUF6588 family protein [Bacteroidales bacterium]
MKKHQIARFPAIFALLFFLNISLYGQLEGEFLKGGINDGMKLLEAYVSPWAKAFGAGFSGGWYNTAKPHKFGGFDITFTVNAGLVPKSETTFDLASLGFEHLTLVDPSGPSIAPTIAGSRNDGPTLHYMSSVSGYDVELARLSSPAGTGLRFVPVPMAQVGIGLPLNSEIKIRFVPKIPIDESDVSMWGVGLMHSIMQYIPGNKLLPFDVSLFGGYTRLNSNIGLDIYPDSYADYENYTFEDFSGQKIAGIVEGWNASLIGSFNLPMITLYGGLGYASSRTVVDVVGNIPLPSVDDTNLPPSVVYNDAGVVTDIMGIDIEDFSGLRANLGFRFKFAVFTIHADYTRSQYNVFTAGLGVSFR